MGQNLTRKIIAEHLVEGEMIPGREIAITIDQTMTHDLQVLGWQQFEAMGLPRGRTELWVNYTDHNMLQTDFRNADDHRYLQSVSAKYGALFSRAGNGICHQVHLERFAAPGKTMVGTDSHTPTAGGMGSLAIGLGGLEAIAASGGGRLYLAMPKVLGVKLTGRLAPWVAAKDIILEVLRRLTVKGGVGRIVEYYGPGAATLSVTQRATICNMGAELGATSSVFPSDERTKAFLEAQGRGQSWKPMAADADATYDEQMEIDLGELEPLIAKPHSPDNVVRVREVEGIPVNQVCIGSCTNSSYEDLMAVAAILKGKTVHSRDQSHRHPRHQAGVHDDRPKRCAGRSHRRRGAYPGGDVRTLLRPGPGARNRRRLRTLLQPQFPGPERYAGRPGLPGEPRNLRRRRPLRGHHRPPHAGRPDRHRAPRPLPR